MPTPDTADSNRSSDWRDLWIMPAGELISFTVFVYAHASGQIRGILPEASPTFIELGLIEHRSESRWTIPNRFLMERYREKSSEYHTDAQSVLIQPHLLADWIVRGHLRHLTLPSREILLLRDKAGRLTPRCLRELKNFHPTFYDTLYSSYIRESCLIV